MRGAADRLQAYGWRVLLGALLAAAIGGIVEALIWEPGGGAVVAQCPAPPCGPESLPGLRDLSTVLPVLGQVSAILLGLPSALVGGWDLLRGRPADAASRLFALVGPILVLAGTEIVPHLAAIGVCAAAAEMCRFSLEWGTDISDRWHLLSHALLGALPMTVIYGSIRRR